MKLKDKNDTIINCNGTLLFPWSGFQAPVRLGDDNHLWVFIGDMIFPITCWDTTKLEFIAYKITTGG